MEAPAAGRLCAIRQRMIERIGANRYRTWFGGTTELQLDGQQLDVIVANAFVENWISSNFATHLVAATRDVIGGEPSIAIHIGDVEGAGARSESAEHTAQPRLLTLPPAATRAGPAPPLRPPRRDARPTLHGDLDTFVVGPSNELAFAVASAVVRSPGQSFKHVVIHSGCGLGKTHLLQGICMGLTRVQPALNWYYLSGEEFTNQFIYAVKGGQIDAFRTRFRSVDVLVIDDIHFLANKRATQAEFLHTFNAIDAAGQAVVLSCDCHPRSIATLTEPLMNRLVAATVVHIDPPDFATRREILRRRAAKMLIELPDEVLDYVARRVTRNVRELEGALFRLAAYAALTKEPVGLDLARRALEDLVNTAQGPEPADIERIVAAHFGLTRDAVRSSSRDRTVTHARSIVMFLLRKFTRLSLPEVGRLLGDKQHSTVLMAVRRVQQLLDQNGAVTWKTPSGVREVPARELLDDLEQRLVARGDGAS